MSTAAKQKAPRVVQDTKGASYQLVQKMSQGGQGVVYRTSHPQVLVKGFTNKDDQAIGRWRRHIEWLVRQDLGGLKLSKPLIMLAPPRNGYVMELMDGLVPLQSLLDSFIEAGDASSEDYLKQGGLRRRVRILCQLARTLNQLHSKGMLYGDLSPSNIFVSDDPEHAETWLIDCDNISLESHSGLTLHTVDYGAPEVVRGDSLLSSLTDAWSFAVIAYQLLSHNHPFKGDMINDGEPEDEEAALRGEHPWINHSEDFDNECSGNLPVQFIEHSRLPELFRRCFEDGLANPAERPSMSEWLEALTECDERMVSCDGCGGHNLLPAHFNEDDTECFFCPSPLDENLVLFEEFIVPAHEEGVAPEVDDWIPTGRKVVMQPGDKRELKRLMPTFSYDRWPEDHLKVEYTEKGLGIRPLPDGTLHVQRGSTIKPVEGYQGLKESLRGKYDTPYWIHIGGLTDQHIVWQFRW
ncbi:protein kinase domain-containing protein [Marinobacter litoralis]|uniref:protein kinase domain-containing protein n=1 Tax=Marinobacter litoralis TaxID=187981 RepID=UPI0018ECF4A5|nr:protein kinase [Marinobacter litoralis]MBJ6137950.1 protein kinase [Marinobacter litoralis]